jgi:hypothetical protein
MANLIMQWAHMMFPDESCLIPPESLQLYKKAKQKLRLHESMNSGGFTLDSHKPLEINRSFLPLLL